MKTVYRNNKELAHVWASNNVPEGRNPGNTFFFNSDGIFSYGRHFCIAKRHDNNTVVMTLSSYSNTTAKQMSYVRRAVSHLKLVYCQDPESSVIWNRRAALDKIDETLLGLEKKGIRETTKDKIRAQAHHIAQTFNDYFAAVSSVGGSECGPIELGEDFVEQYKKMRADEEAAKQKKIEAQKAETLERLEAWKVGVKDGNQQWFHTLPVALRINEDIIQTSHGAAIPLRYAPRLWKIIESVRQTGVTTNYTGVTLGHYTLNTIYADGSIKVGCHNISYAELHRMAVQLKYIEEEQTA